MSSRAGTGADTTDGETDDRPTREVAYRLFATEFEDASFSYSESDEERAPNYVVTPSGARVNRLFAVGVLTEVEQLESDQLRGRIADPTGAFVSYAGQYQPDEMAFLDRTSPPAYVALSGKARTFQPDDSDRVFTSVRPESLSLVDPDTRDRWTVSAADETLHRVGVMAAALRAGTTGPELRAALEAAGVDPSLAAGVPLALERYGTTPAYLAALRRVAVDALEVVAGERDSVRPLDREPGDAGDGSVSLDALAADLDLAHPEADPASETEPAEDPSTAAGDDVAEPETVPEFDETPPAGADDSMGDADESTGDADDPTVGSEAASAETTAGTAETTTATTDTTDPADPAEATTASTSTAESATEPAETTEPAVSTEPSDADTDADAVEETTSASTSEATTASETGGRDETEAGGELGDFDDGAESDAPSATDAASARPDEATDDTDTTEATDDTDTTEATDPTGGEVGDVDVAGDEDGMYELDDEERAELEAEYGTEFSTGSEVDPAGEAGIDVPSVDELEEEFEDDVASTAADDAPVADDATDATAADAESGDGTGADAEPDEDVDLETAAVDAMSALDDGDGASREAVVARVVDAHGVDPGAVEDAIQSALMSGQCYEPSEDTLKAI